ncbi:GspH/FimT family pseudopilin [Shewanella schlegeliana]|uniref:Type II secretion system protein H n=1 Tax=Shewanella schlegeliana TaxID=190308 RepID=A0ABS1SW39_9GAMM|nr:GspH/FimT family pseudopilin [Shewanella schlegeliana]MBL4912124.1 GspH/FimT family pseudopilin [Shewanella schlegeliana]MCL1110790.1 GspH/FimT family pseudopilin [Shewanella schlegeliana]GIU22946.1 type IV minor pilin protein FimT [Shewanella schlegeliana]
MPHRTAGFTLIELMVTLIVATILIVIAAPSFNSFYAQARSDSNIKTIQQLIQMARNHAISYGSRVTVCPISEQICSSNWLDNISIFTDSGQSNIIDGNDQLIYSIGPFNPKDYVSYNRSAIRFQPEGLASGTNGTLKYCPDSINNANSRAVIISQSGRVRFSQKTNISCD